VLSWNQEIVVSSQTGASVLDPLTGSERIHLSFGPFAVFPHIAIWKSKLLVHHAVSVGGKPKGLVCFDLRTGVKEWEMPGGNVESEILVQGDRAILALSKNSFSEIDLTDRKVLWTEQCSPMQRNKYRDSAHFAAPTVVGDLLIFQNNESVQAWNLNSRKRVYELNSSRYSPPTISSDAIVTYRLLKGQSWGSTWCYDTKTGKQLWQKAATGESSAPGWEYARISGQSYYATQKGALHRFDLRSGKELWKLQLAPAEEFNRENFVITPGETSWLALAGIHEVSPSGKLLNSIPIKESFGVVWRVKDYILTNDYDAVSGYRLQSRELSVGSEIDRVSSNLFAMNDVEADYFRTHKEEAGPLVLKALGADLGRARGGTGQQEIGTVSAGSSI
jgi:hypothetical protein